MLAKWFDGAVREVEVKYHLIDAVQVESVLLARGLVLSAPILQNDQAYAPRGWSYGDSKAGVSFVRLRTVGDMHTFTLKRPHENALSCAEHETQVDDRDAMHEAIQLMGYEPTMQIVKTRRTASDGALSICLDEVEGLGAFLELERMVPAEIPGEAVQAEMAAYVAGLGIDAVRTEETYDSLVRAGILAAVGS